MEITRTPIERMTRFVEKGGRKIKDCTNCIFPYKPENYEAMVRILKEM